MAIGTSVGNNNLAVQLEYTVLTTAVLCVGYIEMYTLESCSPISSGLTEAQQGDVLNVVAHCYFHLSLPGTCV